MFRRLVDQAYESILQWQCRHIPRHIAIIQDGNRRFAWTHRMKSRDGHRAGADRTEKVLDWAHELGIQHITLYSFSTENFSRDQEEVEELFALFKERFERVLDDERVHRHHIRVQMVGDRSMLPPDLIEVIERAEESTKNYNRYFLNVALAYGGRNEIVQAARKILAEIEEGIHTIDDISEEFVNQHLYAGRDIPPVDLIIRTGNDYRTSNFLPWLANGHECAVYFSAPYWPDFRKIDLFRAIRVYSQRVESQKEENKTICI
ncbi:MAG TPA: polyprenyl diphosphate synthase [Methanoregulaceae archaeon]|nr:polyprenyl diphosphate synthase [Methanoregulaceae archaeon]